MSVGTSVDKSVESAGRPGERPFPTAGKDQRTGPELAINLLGEVSVRRGGEPLPLPRSRKCRALIAYLAATGRPQRREHLCEMFWDVPDDPKGELRWSLSKIRRVLGDALVADRESVSIDPQRATIDSAGLRNAAKGIDTLQTDAMEELAGSCERPFGQDLDLQRCPEFQAWLIGIREDVRQMQLALLDELIKRLREEPERALPFARARVTCDPLDEGARQTLLALLGAAGRYDEAERQRQLAIEVLDSAGIAVPSQLSRPIGAARPMPECGKGRIQRIQFCTAPDRTRIAYSAVGHGPMLVKTANWMGHLEFEWESPLFCHWLVELSRANTLVRYDARGNGLSDRTAADLSLDAFVRDLETVTDSVGADRFDLLGISQGSPVAIAFAAKHPAKVRKLVLFGGFAAGWRHNPSPQVHARWNAMMTLTMAGWGTNNPAFRQMFTSLFVPRATTEQQDWFNEHQRVSASPEESQRLQRAISEFDVRDRLAEVQTPTLVFHCRGDAMVPFDNGRYLAAHVPGAEFVGLESDNHLPLEGEPAWTVFVNRFREFLSR